MSDSDNGNQPGGTRMNTSAGHLSLHVEGAHPAEIEFSFDREPKRLSAAFVASAVIDCLLVVLLILASRYHPAISASALLPEEPNKNIIWLSQPGPGGGAGTGTGTGIGPGTGSGLGPGSGGGTGGGTYRPGNGVTTPRVLKEVKPQYTSDAMRAKVQGSVWLECVVRPDGSVGDVKVIRSLDSTFGLDLEAMKAARPWKF